MSDGLPGDISDAFPTDSSSSKTVKTFDIEASQLTRGKVKDSQLVISRRQLQLASHTHTFLTFRDDFSLEVL